MTAAVSADLSLAGLIFLLYGQSQCVDLECVFDPHLLHGFLAVFSFLFSLLDLTAPSSSVSSSSSPYVSCPCCFDHSFRCCASCVRRDFSWTLLFLALIVLVSSRAFFRLRLSRSSDSLTPSYTGRLNCCRRSNFQWKAGYIIVPG